MFSSVVSKNKGKFAPRLPSGAPASATGKRKPSSKQKESTFEQQSAAAQSPLADHTELTVFDQDVVEQPRSTEKTSYVVADEYCYQNQLLLGGESGNDCGVANSIVNRSDVRRSNAPVEVAMLEAMESPLLADGSAQPIENSFSSSSVTPLMPNTSPSTTQWNTAESSPVFFVPSQSSLSQIIEFTPTTTTTTIDQSSVDFRPAVDRKASELIPTKVMKKRRQAQEIITSNSLAEPTQPAKVKKPRKSRVRPTTTSSSSATPPVVDSLASVDDDESLEQNASKPRKPKIAATEAPLEPPDTATISVSDLARASYRFRGGKAMARQFVSRQAGAASSSGSDEENIGAATLPPNSAPDHSATQASTTADAAADVPMADSQVAAQSQFSGPRVRLVNGQIVLDQSSLQIVSDPTSAAATQGMREVVEHQETRRITSASFANRAPMKKWLPVEVDRFYQGLRRWGTDFEMITTLFPGRSRRNIKLLYNREERLNPARVDYALRNPLDATVVVVEQASNSAK